MKNLCTLSSLCLFCPLPRSSSTPEVKSSSTLEAKSFAFEAEIVVSKKYATEAMPYLREDAGERLRLATERIQPQFVCGCSNLEDLTKVLQGEFTVTECKETGETLGNSCVVVLCEVLVTAPNTEARVEYREHLEKIIADIGATCLDANPQEEVEHQKRLEKVITHISVMCLHAKWLDAKPQEEVERQKRLEKIITRISTMCSNAKCQEEIECQSHLEKIITGISMMCSNAKYQRNLEEIIADNDVMYLGTKFNEYAHEALRSFWCDPEGFRKECGVVISDEESKRFNRFPAISYAAGIRQGDGYLIAFLRHVVFGGISATKLLEEVCSTCSLKGGANEMTQRLENITKQKIKFDEALTSFCNDHSKDRLKKVANLNAVFLKLFGECSMAKTLEFGERIIDQIPDNLTKVKLRNYIRCIELMRENALCCAYHALSLTKNLEDERSLVESRGD